MKRKISLAFLLFLAVNSCKKTRQDPGKAQPVKQPLPELTIGQVKTWLYGTGPDTTTNQREILTAVNAEFGQLDLGKAECVFRTNANWWVLHMAGQPVFGGVRQGYRKLVFYRDTAGAIRVHILESIPDALYIQRRLRATTADFTGRVFIYDEQYHLQQGLVYARGKVIGSIKPRTKTTQTDHLKTDEVTIEKDCSWVDGYYVDGDNGPVIYSEQVCTTIIYDGGADAIGGGSGAASGGDYLGGGGGGGGDAGSAPAPSNLPNEDDPKIDPKKYMDCFGTVPDAGAKTTVTVYVQEPWPGTSFNVGPNSVGHVCIGLTKTNGNTTITQVVGFYPDASGFAKINAPSKVLDNGGDLQYNVSITYAVLPSEFNNIVNYVSHPPVTYDLATFNCTNFVYSACQTGNITLPDPYSPLLFDATKAMTPGALGKTIEKLAGEPGVNTNGGITPFSKGACN